MRKTVKNKDFRTEVSKLIGFPYSCSLPHPHLFIILVSCHITRNAFETSTSFGQVNNELLIYLVQRGCFNDEIGRDVNHELCFTSPLCCSWGLSRGKRDSGGVGSENQIGCAKGFDPGPREVGRGHQENGF